MPSYTSDQIRNVALVGHSGAGKTTLFEALLHAGGTSQAAGSVERGTTVSDFDPMEKARQHSLNTVIASIDHGGIHVNLIDTPGYPDFRGPTLSALAAVETCAVVINGQNGIEYSTHRMMEYAKARGLCRLLIVNKIDGANLPLLVDRIRETFGPECLPINLPSQGGKAVVDCFTKPAGVSDFGTVSRSCGFGPVLPVSVGRLRSSAAIAVSFDCFDIGASIADVAALSAATAVRLSVTASTETADRWLRAPCCCAKAGSGTCRRG